MIVILEERLETDVDDGSQARAVTIWITDGGPVAYIHEIGNLPLIGDLQTLLGADETNIWIDAQAAGRVATGAETALAEFTDFLIDNPGAGQLFNLSRAELETAIADLVTASFGALSANNRTRWRLLLQVLALAVRKEVAE